MAGLRHGLDEVVIATVVGLVFIVLAYAEGLGVRGTSRSQPAAVQDTLSAMPLVMVIGTPDGSAP